MSGVQVQPHSDGGGGEDVKLVNWLCVCSLLLLSR